MAAIGGIAMGMALPAGAQAQGVARTAALNDTGLTTCWFDDGSTSSDCAATGQDAAFGRDVTAAEDADGRAGFSFVKVGPSGKALASTTPKWACLKDAVTGLLWEIKSSDDGLRDYRLRYTNYGDRREGDASAYVDAINAAGLCGHSDWRLPTRGELLGIVDFGREKGAVTLDATWFADTGATWTWTSDDYVGANGKAWVVDFSTAHVYFDRRRDLHAVRLVRSPQPSAQPQFVPNGAEVRDTTTGLIWARCSEGQVWDGNTCLGFTLSFIWKKAVERATQVASETGVAWRLPNPKELASLVDAQRFAPTIDTDAFPGTPATWYWTSAFDSSSTTTSFFVNFFHGGVYDHDRHRQYAVRLVRTAP